MLRCENQNQDLEEGGDDVDVAFRVWNVIHNTVAQRCTRYR
jgi:hypothetical protein